MMCSCPGKNKGQQVVKTTVPKEFSQKKKKKVKLELSTAACDDVTFHSGKYHIHTPRADLVSGKQYQVT